MFATELTSFDIRLFDVYIYIFYSWRYKFKLTRTQISQLLDRRYLLIFGMRL